MLLYTAVQAAHPAARPAAGAAGLQPGLHRLAVLHRCSYTVTIRQLVGSILRIANSDPHFRGELRIVIRKYAANCVL